jgi:integrase
MSERGDGYIYKPKDRDGKEYPVWYLAYYDHGRLIRRTTKTTDEQKAKKQLKQRMAEVRTGTHTRPQQANIKVDALYEISLEHYELKKRKSLPDFKARWRIHLKPFFGGRPASQVSTELVNRYIKQRQEENAASTTINRELAALKKMFNYAAKRAKKIKLDSVPFFEMLEENENGRTDFVQDEQYGPLADAFGRVGLWARAIFEVGFSFGFRKSELLGLRVRNINLQTRTITLPPRSTKNRQPRLIVMTERVYQLLCPLAEGKNPDDFLFTRQNGKPVRDFTAIWQRCCVEAGVGRMVCTACAPEIHGECTVHGTEKLRWTDKPGKGSHTGFTRKVCLSCAPSLTGKQCPTCEKNTVVAYDGLLVHGLRRTAAVNLTMAGVPKQYAKQVTGHQEDKMFDRYSKIARKQMEQTTRQLESYQNSKTFNIHSIQPEKVGGPALVKKAN